MRKQQNKRARRSTNNNVQTTLFRAPQHKTPVTSTHTYRFVAGSTATVSVTLCELIGVAGMINYAANNNTFYCDAVKIHKIEAWTDAVVTNSVKLEWYSGLEYVKPEVWEDQCQSTAAPAHIRVRPPRGVFSNWLSALSLSVNPTLFTINATIGTIVDVTLSHSYWATTDLTNPINWVSTAAGTSGKIYYLPLDGTTGIYKPVDLPTLV
jgi:hypothetical protein